MLEDVTVEGFAAGAQIRALLELQGLKVAVVAGGAANANLALAGIKTTDTLVSVVAHPSAAVTQKVIAGGATATPLVVGGLDTADALISVLRYPAAGGPPTDVTGEVTVTAGHISLSTTTTTGDTLVVTYQETAGGVVDVTSTASINAANVIRNSVDTSGTSLLVVYFPKPAVQPD